jgi:hypothetical protein
VRRVIATLGFGLARVTVQVAAVIATLAPFALISWILSTPPPAI